MDTPRSSAQTEQYADAVGSKPLSRNELIGVVVFWTFIALLGVATDIIDPPRGARAASPLSLRIVQEFFEAYVWAALTPFIFRLGRLPMERSRWIAPALVLAAAGLATSVAVDVLENLFEIHVLGSAYGAAGASPVQSLSRMWFLNDLLIFLAVLTAGFAREYFQRYQARQEQALNLQARAARLEAQLAAARLDALRMQINPHFLFNTLHAVSSLVHRDPDGVRRMVAKLAGLLRATLQDGSEPEVTLERELEFLEDYLEIMRIRFQGRLEIEFDIDASLLDAAVPHLILQPLVENAVKHGVAKTDAAVRVKLTAGAEADRLILAVLDSGPGLPEKDGSMTEGIGIRNVRERLARLYGDAAALSLQDREQGGARAEIRMPLRRMEDAERPLTAAGSSRR